MTGLRVHGEAMRSEIAHAADRQLSFLVIDSLHTATCVVHSPFIDRCLYCSSIAAAAALQHIGPCCIRRSSLFWPSQPSFLTKQGSPQRAGSQTRPPALLLHPSDVPLCQDGESCYLQSFDGAPPHDSASPLQPWFDSAVVLQTWSVGLSQLSSEQQQVVSG